MEKTFDEKSALELIETMINTANQQVRDNGFYFLFWGWLVFVAAITDYVMMLQLQIDNHAIVWTILMPLGGIATMIISILKGKQPMPVKTYTGEMMKYGVTAFVISLTIICLIMPWTNNWRSFYPVLMVLYASWLFLAGGALRFKPLVYGSFANWVAAGVAFFVTYDYQLLLLAFAMLTGFIIPGHILKLRFDKSV